jgi:Kef-type K+ transport system membrane component KefB
VSYLAERGLNRLAIGIGMTPRGELGLIFVGMGRSFGVVKDSVFASVVIMVIVTTLLRNLSREPLKGPYPSMAKDFARFISTSLVILDHIMVSTVVVEATCAFRARVRS